MHLTDRQKVQPNCQVVANEELFCTVNNQMGLDLIKCSIWHRFVKSWYELINILNMHSSRKTSFEYHISPEKINNS